MSTTACPTCQQEVPGPDEPTAPGSIATCSCGSTFVKLRRPPTAAPSYTDRWRDVSREKSAAGWLRVLVDHTGAGHDLTIIRPGGTQQGSPS